MTKKTVDTLTKNSAGFDDEASTPKKPGRKSKGKRVQVSVYLNQDTYNDIRLMAGNMNQTISDILEVFADNFVELNHDAIQAMKNAWNGIQVKFK